MYLVCDQRHVFARPEVAVDMLDDDEISPRSVLRRLPHGDAG